jgi:hypothetical protein
MAKQYKAVLITGPRQSGKTTLARHEFPDKPYVSFENPDTRMLASQDPRSFYPDTPTVPYSTKRSACRIFSLICSNF